MTEVVLFHHAHGLTDGVHAFADRLRDAGHVAHTPDLYEGQAFATLDEGIAHARSVGFDQVLERGRVAGEALPAEVVLVGISLGVMPAQLLAQTRPGARGAILVSGCIPPSEFGTPWPSDVPVQIHLMESDPFALEGDLDAARGLADAVDEAELFLYPGDRHLFADIASPDHDEDAAGLVMERTLAFLARVG